MPQDAFNLRYLCNELNELLKGGKINRIIQPENDKIVFTVYNGKTTEKLFLDVNPSSPRIGVTKLENDTPLSAPNFCMLLRKHLLNATIDGISLIGFDRIVRIDLTPSNEFFDGEKKTIFVELMGRYSNIILTENGKVLGGNRGINFFDNGVRPLIVGKAYVYPPTNDKKLPNDERLKDDFLSLDRNNFSESLASLIQGIALSTASEIESEFNRQNNDSLTDEEFAKKLYEKVNEFLYSISAKPTVYFDSNGIAIDVTAIDYKTLEKSKRYFDSVIDAEEYFFREKDRVKKFNQKREKLTGIISALIKKSKKKLTAILSREKDASNAEENRIKGELILANIYRIKQGDKHVELTNYYDNSEMKITLDEHLSPAKNSEVYYKKYNKQKRALEALTPQREQAEKELGYYNSVFDEISFAENIEDLIYIENELENTGVIIKQNPKGKKNTFTPKFIEYNIDGFIVKVGRNNVENDRVTFTAKPEDIWIHAKDCHSSHLIIETNGKDIEESHFEIIKKSAEICAYYSKGRNDGKCEVVYTKKKNVKKPSKSKAGFVTYVEFKSIVVVPNKHDNYLKNN